MFCYLINSEKYKSLDVSCENTMERHWKYLTTTIVLRRCDFEWCLYRINMKNKFRFLLFCLETAYLIFTLVGCKEINTSHIHNEMSYYAYLKLQRHIWEGIAVNVNVTAQRLRSTVLFIFSRKNLNRRNGPFNILMKIIKPSKA